VSFAPFVVLQAPLDDVHTACFPPHHLLAPSVEAKHSAPPSVTCMTLRDTPPHGAPLLSTNPTLITSWFCP
jgi:hypothetical protein